MFTKLLFVVIAVSFFFYQSADANTKRAGPRADSSTELLRSFRRFNHPLFTIRASLLVVSVGSIFIAETILLTPATLAAGLLWLQPGCGLGAISVFAGTCPMRMNTHETG